MYTFRRFCNTSDIFIRSGFFSPVWSVPSVRSGLMRDSPSGNVTPFGGCYPFVTPFEPKNGEKVGNLRTNATCQLSLDSPDFDVLCSALHPHNLRNISAFRLLIQSLSHWADSNRRPTHYEGKSEIDFQLVAHGRFFDVTPMLPQVNKNS